MAVVPLAMHWGGGLRVCGRHHLKLPLFLASPLRVTYKYLFSASAILWFRHNNPRMVRNRSTLSGLCYLFYLLCPSVRLYAYQNVCPSDITVSSLSANCSSERLFSNDCSCCCCSEFCWQGSGCCLLEFYCIINGTISLPHQSLSQKIIQQEKSLFCRRKATYTLYFVGLYVSPIWQLSRWVSSPGILENHLFFCNSRYITEPFPPSHIFLKLSRHAYTMVPGHIAMSSWPSNIYITNVIIACKAFRLIYLQGVH